VCSRIFEALRLRIPETRVLFDDVLVTLEMLKQRGYILGVVTNRGRWRARCLWIDMGKMGLLDYFAPTTMAISADLGISQA